MGFIGVLQAEELKAELTLCGVKLPAEEVPGSEPDAPPTLGKLITLILAAALLIGYVIHEVQTNDKLFLTFWATDSDSFTFTVNAQEKQTTPDTPGEYLYSSRSGVYSQHSRDLMEVIDTPQLQMFRSTHEGANVLCCSRKAHALYFPAQQ